MLNAKKTLAREVVASCQTEAGGGPGGWFSARLEDVL